MAMRNKNYRFSDDTIRKVHECMDSLGLHTEVLAHRIAIELLHEHRNDLNITKYLIRLRNKETADDPQP